MRPSPMMARRRFFVDEICRGVASMEGDEALHLTRVLRVEKGQRFEISDNTGLWLAEVTEARKSLIAFQVIEPLDPGPALPELHLYSALFKFDRFEWMVEKATELGMTRLIPIESERSDQGLFAAAAKRVERWRKIARESSQQSRRMKLPLIEDPVRLRQIEAQGALLMLDEAPGTPLLRVPDRRPVALLLGPEGGWTDEERFTLSSKGWSAASLGPTILRAETAGIGALAIMTHGLAGS